MVISLASLLTRLGQPDMVTPQATSILCRTAASGAFLAQPWLATWSGGASRSALPIGRPTGKP